MIYLGVGDASQAQDQQRPRPRHDVAGPSNNTDLFKAAAVCCEAGLSGTDVAAPCCPIEEQPAT